MPSEQDFRAVRPRQPLSLFCQNSRLKARGHRIDAGPDHRTVRTRDEAEAPDSDASSSEWSSLDELPCWRSDQGDERDRGQHRQGHSAASGRGHDNCASEGLRGPCVDLRRSMPSPARIVARSAL